MQTQMHDRDAIVSNAIEIPSEPVRSAYIAGACGNDIVLKQQVEELVAAHFQSAGKPAGAHATQTPEVLGAPKRHHQSDLANEMSEVKKMEQKSKPRGMITLWALLLLPVTIGGAGLTAWKLRAEGPEQATLERLQDELEQTRKSEAAVKKQLEEAWEARRSLERERDEALASESEARRSTDDAKAVLAFLRDNVLLAPGRPTSWSREGLGKDVTLRKAVEAAAAKVEGAFPDRPMVEASIREMLGASYLDVGEPEQAVKQYQRAFTLRENELGPDHPDTCDCRNKLAIAYRDAGHLDEASRLYELNRLTKKADVATKKRTPQRPSVSGKDAAPKLR